MKQFVHLLKFFVLSNTRKNFRAFASILFSTVLSACGVSMNVAQDSSVLSSSVDVGTVEPVNKSNLSAYNIAGDCPDKAQAIIVSVQSDEFTVPCVNGKYEQTLDLSDLSDGTYAATVTPQFSANKGTPTQISIIVDTTAPTATMSVVSGLTKTSPIAVTFTASETLNGLSAQDFTVTNGQVSLITQAANIYTLNVVPSADGNVVVHYSGSRTDIAGNLLVAPSDVTVMYDSTAPTVTMSVASGLTKTSPIVVTFTASEPLNGLSAQDFTVTNGQVTLGAQNGNIYSLVVVPNSDGYVMVHYSGSRTDVAGNLLVAPSDVTVMYDSTAPTATMSVVSGLTKTSPIAVTFTASETLNGLSAQDFTVTNGQVSLITQAANIYTLNVVPSADGNVVVHYSGSRTDIAGNLLVAPSDVTVLYDTTAPTAVSSLSIAAAVTANTVSTPQITWGAASDAGSGVHHYLVSMSSSFGVADVVGWTNVGNVTQTQFLGLNLVAGTYYISVQAVDALNIIGPTTTASYVVKTQIPRPNVYLQSGYDAQSVNVQITTANCSFFTDIYVTENSAETPTGSEGSWQNCSTNSGAITYTLSNSNVGAKSLYVWSKDSVTGLISQTSKELLLRYVPSVIWGQPDANTLIHQNAGLNGPTAIRYIQNRVYLAGGFSSLINVYNTIPSQNFQMPDFYLGKSLGQPNNTSGVTPNQHNQIQDIVSDGVNFALVDSVNNRVLIWNSIPTSQDSLPDVVIGQTNFYSGAINNGYGASPDVLNCSMLNGPKSVTIAGGKLIVTDAGNNRVLIWNSLPTQNYQSADLVLGQPDCTTNTFNIGGISGAVMKNPQSALVVGTKLFVADGANQRVLAWNNFPTANGQVADFALGQASFTANTANRGAGTAADNTFNFPMRMTSDGTNFVVADANNNRVLIWNSIPTTMGQSANVVVGQVDMVSKSSNQGGLAGANTLSVPQSAELINGDLWVVDTNNHRVLKYSGIPSANGANASFVLAQSGMVGQTKSYSAGTNNTTFGRPFAIELVDSKVYVSEYSSNRVSIFNSLPTSAATPIDVQFGQSSFTIDQPNQGSTTAIQGGMNNPAAVLSISNSANSKFFVSDASNNRVLGYNSAPTSSGALPDFVLGQPDFVSNTTNNGGVSASSMRIPQGLATDGVHFAVADYSNHRVLIWNSIPSSTFQPADVVVGQPDKVSAVKNNGGISGATMSGPRGVAFSGNKLIVADTENLRLLIWNQIPTTDGVPADIVIGQPDMQSSHLSWPGVPSISPVLITTKNGQLFVQEQESQRSLIWDQIPTQNNQMYDRSFGGQVSPGVVNSGSILNQYNNVNFYAVATDGARLFIPEYGGQRLNVMPIPEFSVLDDYYTNQHQVRLTVHNCTHRPFVLFNEGAIPAANAPEWQSCSTARNSYTYTTSSGDGNKFIKAWFKDEDGNVLHYYFVSTVYVKTNGLRLSGINLTSTSPTNSTSLSFSSTGYMNLGQASVVKVFISETNVQPSLSDSGWIDNTSSFTYTLSGSTNGLRTVYIWGVDAAGNITPTSISYTINFDTTPPVVPNATLSGYYLATSNSFYRFTMANCTDASYILVNESTQPNASDTGWIACSTSVNAITFNSTSQGVAAHTFNIWSKDKAGNVSTTPTTVNHTVQSGIALGQNDASTLSGATTGLNTVRGIDSDGTHFVVTDSSNSRVLFYNGDPTTNNPVYVLGQQDLQHVGCNAGGVSASSLCNPIDAIIVGNRIFVSDYGNNRILVWDQLPTQNGQSASYVLGQTNFTSTGTSPRTCASLSAPYSLWSDGNHLIVGDFNNSRTLIWNNLPTQTGVAADVVVGQNSCTTAATTLNEYFNKTPAGGLIYNNKLYVSDRGNNRVLIYNSVPTAHGAAASNVIGQTNFTTNSTGVTATTYSAPGKIAIYNNTLFVPDTNNRRVLVYNSLPTTDGASANIVLGKADFVSNSTTTGQNVLNTVYGVYVNASSVWVSEVGSSKIKRFDGALSTNMNASAFLGGYDYNSSWPLARTSTSSSGTQFQMPGQAITVGSKFIVADIYNNRVLIWNSVPTSSTQVPDVVLGQPDFIQTTANNSNVASLAGRLFQPSGVASDGTKLFVADYNNSRVLIWNSIPTVNGASADLVLGQSVPTSGTSANRGGAVAANTLKLPRRVTVVNSQVFVSDNGNNRVLIWNSIPSSSGVNADVVVGQSSMTSGTANAGGISGATLSAPYGITVSGSNLFIADGGNNRVLIYNTIPTANGATANNVIGQASLTASVSATNDVGLQAPKSIVVVQGRVYISDSSNNRITVYNSIPSTNGVAADSVIGQASYNTSYANNRGVSPLAVTYPNDIFYDGTNFWISDGYNHRVFSFSIQ